MIAKAWTLQTATRMALDQDLNQTILGQDQAQICLALDQDWIIRDLVAMTDPLRAVMTLKSLISRIMISRMRALYFGYI